MISAISCRVSVRRRSDGSSPSSTSFAGSGAEDDQPQIMPAMARDHVLRQAHDLAHLADGGAGAEMDDGGGQPGAVPPVAVVDVLDHLLAPLMLEIDVDVGRLAALVRDEALEHQVDAVGRHLGDAER